MKVVVIGGTGLIGSKLVNKLRAMGQDVLAASPDTGVNTLTGDGLNDALVGAQVVVDVSNSPSFEDEAVMRFFKTSTRNLLDAEALAAMSHHVVLSVVGTDRLRLAWCRDANCGPPRWPVKKVSGEHLTLSAPAEVWQVEFFDTTTGKSLGTTRLASEKGRLRLELPPFEGSVAARITSIAP